MSHGRLGGDLDGVVHPLLGLLEIAGLGVEPAHGDRRRLERGVVIGGPLQLLVGGFLLAEPEKRRG